MRENNWYYLKDNLDISMNTNYWKVNEINISFSLPQQNFLTVLKSNQIRQSHS